MAALREQLMHSNCMDDLLTFSARDPDTRMILYDLEMQNFGNGNLKGCFCMFLCEHGQFDSMT